MRVSVLEHKQIAWSEIEGWVDEDLLLYFQKDLELSREGSLEVLQEVKKFLLVHHNHAREGVKFSPSVKVDEAWHKFILFTPIYSHFCRKVLGREFTIGHVPNVGSWDSRPKGGALGDDGMVNPGYVETLERIKEETGGLIAKFWPEPSCQAFQKSCSSCHGCNGGSGDCTAPD